MNIAIVGCGYVAEFYAETLGAHPELTLVGVYDNDPQRLTLFAGRWKTRTYPSLEAVLADPAVELVLDLANPRAHYAINRACLEAGKHVYSEKPLAMTAAEARELVEIAGAKGVRLASAPCSMLSQAARTAAHALRAGVIGKVRLVYANFDDGMIAPRQAPWTWSNKSGVPWPAKDEFEVGCTYEHAGYVLTWLGAFFGPARRMTSFASTQIADKGIAVDGMAPDFTVGCIEYDDGIVARVTTGLVAPLDKSISVVGDRGVLTIPHVRRDAGSVYYRRIPAHRHTARLERLVNKWRRKLGWPLCETDWHFWSRCPAQGAGGVQVSADKPVDFLLGPAEMAVAMAHDREPLLSAEFGAHIVEIVERLQYPERFAGCPMLDSSFTPFSLAA